MWAAAAFDGPILGCVSGGVLKVIRAVVPGVNGRRCPALLGLFFVWSDARLPYFLFIKALCCCKSKMALIWDFVINVLMKRFER